MIKLKKLIKESNVWDRKFGEPLPTLKNVVEKHEESVKEDLDPYKDFGSDQFKPEYNLNLGAFVDQYQKFMKFMKKHKEVPDKNKREWALAIRNKVGQGMFNGHMNQMSNIMDLLQKGEKFRNLKESVNEKDSND
jgi:hypothetical protein